MITSQKTFFAFQGFGCHVSVEHDEKHPQPKLGGIGSWGPEIGPHEYLISPIEISANWPCSYTIFALIDHSPVGRIHSEEWA